MNVFNRVVLIILLLLILATAVFALIVPATVLGGLRDSLVTLYGAVLPYRLASGAFWAYLGSTVGVIALCVLFLWLELRPPRRKDVEVTDSEGRTILVSVKAITQRLQSALNGVADVSRIKPKVISRGRKADVHLDVQVDPASDLRFKTEEISQLTREVIRDQLGVSVGRVRVHMQYGPETARPAPRPAVTEAVPGRAPGAPPVTPEPEQAIFPATAEEPAIDGSEPDMATPVVEDWPIEHETLPPA
jgi:hypothetical protein